MDYVSYIFFGVFCGYTSYIGFANFILHRHCLTYTASLLIYSHVPSSPLSRFARCTDVVQLYFDVSICHSDTSPIDPKDGFKCHTAISLFTLRRLVLCCTHTFYVLICNFRSFIW
ncbi:hypothetical protein P167DRAFT_299484 [Morchella conica CCBAS932]|uniref:Uncharacterized protein n=1 Tax=Morchella conica CCBAS932 TaxID=1392247 RepID=A0A3N4KG44_9PEZI|nr:hypothetical protein P167DRAFT_299484 [Morchella conica CCBAS932]